MINRNFNKTQGCNKGFWDDLFGWLGMEPKPPKPPKPTMVGVNTEQKPKENDKPKEAKKPKKIYR